eukprot:4161807-Pleurochrysis_carterae.AAC.1
MVQWGEPQHATSTWDIQGGHDHANKPKRDRFIHQASVVWKSPEQASIANKPHPKVGPSAWNGGK